MARSSAAQPLRLKPLTGSFDSRSLPELVSDQTWRLLVNTRTNERGSLCRGNGWQKFLNGFITTRDYNGEDGHDQLLSLSGYYNPVEGADDSGVIEYPPTDALICGSTFIPYSQGRQPYTYLAEVVSTVGTRTILYGTQSRLYELLIGKGALRILRDNLGGIAANPEIRLRHAQTGDFVLLTNNYDRPFSWLIGTGASGCLMNSTEEIPELETIGLAKSLVTFQFRGLLFLANNEEDGERRSSMVRWSGVDPTNWIEDPGFSLAGHYEIDFGEEVLAGGVIGNFAYLHTTRGIWQISVNPDPTVVFNFTKIYSTESGERCIEYPFTFIDTGDTQRYMAKDGIYTFNPVYGVPVREEWIHQSSNILYDNLNKSRCSIHTAGFDPVTQSMYFSCALGDDSLPSVTLYANARYQQCSKLDFGSTAFLSCTPNNEPSLRDWLVQNCICTEEELESEELMEIGFNTVKEGDGVPQNTPPCESFPQYIYTSVELVIDEELTMEDFNEEEAGEDAICNAFPEATLADLCLHCEGQTFFIFAHAGDWAVKSLDESLSREMFDADVFTEGEDPVYVIEGYETRFLKGPMLLGQSGNKVIEHVSLEFSSDVQLEPLLMHLRVGRSARAEDPIEDTGYCGITWQEDRTKAISCVNNDRRMEWPVFLRGESIYLDFSFDGIGGGSCYSSLEVMIREDGPHI